MLQHRDREQVEAKLGAWAQEVLTRLPPASTDEDAIALDGKTLRGGHRQGALPVHLLSALSHRWGLTVGQQAVDAKTNEIGVIVPLLQERVLEGHLSTMEALLTKRAVAQTILVSCACTGKPTLPLPVATSPLILPQHSLSLVCRQLNDPTSTLFPLETGRPAVYNHLKTT